MRKLLAAAIVAAVTGMFAGTVQAEDYRLLRLDGKLVKWGKPDFGTGATLTYALASRKMKFPGAINCRQIQPLENMLVRSGVTMQNFESELKAAFLAWERVANLKFRRVDDPTAANIVIGAQVKPRGHAFANVAYEEESEGELRTISKSLICFNPQRRWKVGFDGDRKIYDLRFTLIHEIGHTIGLDHEGSGGQIMGFSYHEAFRAPQKGDREGALKLYGPPVGAPLVAGGGGTKPAADTQRTPGSPVLSLGREGAARDRN